MAVLDIRMPELDGTQVLAAMRQEGLGTEVLFLSAFMEPELAYKTVASGAKGYLSKESSRQEVCEAIVSIARGGTALRRRGAGRARAADPASASAAAARRS